MAGGGKNRFRETVTFGEYIIGLEFSLTFGTGVQCVALCGAGRSDHIYREMLVTAFRGAG